MPVFLTGKSALDMFQCYVCGRQIPKAVIHEHHKVKKSLGGQDTMGNMTVIDSYCHTALHQIEAALRNPKKHATIQPLLEAIYPDNPDARKRCMELATIAALGKDPKKSDEQMLDYSIFDEEDEVYVTPPPKVHPQTRKQVKIVAKELKNPRTGRSLGVSGYLRMLIENDLRKRGFKVISLEEMKETKKT